MKTRTNAELRKMRQADTRRVRATQNFKPLADRVAGMVQVWDNEAVVAAALSSKGWLYDVCRNEAMSRGLDENGEWVGFKESEGVWR